MAANRHGRSACPALFYFPLGKIKSPRAAPREVRPGAERAEQTRQREQLSRHIPPALQTNPGVAAGDSWGLPRVSLAQAQLMPPVTCELDGEERVEGFRARGMQKLHAWRRRRRRRIAQQLAGSKVHCEKACPRGKRCSQPASRSQTSGSSPPSARAPGAYPTAQPFYRARARGKANPKPRALAGPAQWPRASRFEGTRQYPRPARWG